jgi:4-aminobutyrate aminotransferase
MLALMTETARTIQERSTATLSPVLGRYYQQAWVKGQGHFLYDSEGNSYLDFANGIAVTSLGHAHPKVNAAIKRQVDALIHVCNGLGHLDPVTRLAEMLVAELPEPLDTVYFGNSGAEVVDGAMKMARRATGKTHIIAFSEAFHGRTYGATSLTSSSLNYRSGYDPLVPDIHIAPFPNAYRDFDGDEERASEVCLDHLERLFAGQIQAASTAAFIIEPVQGEGGYVPAPISFLQGLRELATRHGILLIADEVQSGYGRTGRMWAFEHAGIVPDVVLAAKAIANGMPLAALISPRELQERWGVGAHGSTYGGNPVSCAAGIAVLEVMHEEHLVANAAERGAELTAGLKALQTEDPRIGDIRGPGLMIGVEMIKDPAAPDVALGSAMSQACNERGLLVLTCGAGNVVRWIPPLDVQRSEIEQALGIFQEALLATR